MTNGQDPSGSAGRAQHGFDRSDELAELASEVRLLVEALLERIEPALRKTALGIGQEEWDSCSWCPVCAMAALLRGQRHDVVTAVAEHGTAIVTVLREALAGVPVEPRMPGGAPPAPDQPAPADVKHERTTSASYTDIPVTVR